MNKLLQQQLQEHFGETGKVPENFSKLLTVISGSYDNYEQNQQLIEHSIELSSNEMIELNSDLKKEKEELKKAHSELQQALGNITKIMDSSLDVICAVDAKGNFIKVSAASEAVWGYKPEELIGKPLINFVYQKDNEKTQATAGRVMAGNNIGHFENRYIRKDGSLVPIEWSARWDENDKIRYGVARDVTEKKELEKAFEIERQRFYDLFLNAPSSVGILKGPGHLYEMANPLFLQLIGKDDIIGKPVKEVLPELAGQGFIEMLDNVYKTGIPFSANEMLAKLDKEGNGKLAELYLNFVCQAYRNNEDIIEGIFFFIVDVTEQVLSRKKIEESEKGYRQIVETAQEGIWLIDENNVTTFVNKKMAEILEYTVEEMMGKKNYCFMNDESQKKASEHIVKRKLGMNENHDFNYVAKSGKNVWTNLSTNPVFDDAGIYRGALAMVTDITERKETEDKIKISELRYRSLVEQATDAICITDASMKFTDINPYALGMFGYTLEEALKLSLPDILFAEDLVANPIKLKELELGKTTRNERRLKRKNGTAVDMAVSTKLMEDGRLIMFGHDITERKKSEEALIESEKRLRQIINLVPHFIFAKDANGKFVLANEAVANAYGCTVEDLIGKTDADFNSKKEEVEHFMQEDLKVISSGNTKYNIEETITDITGGIRVLSTTKIPYTSPGADTPGVLGVSVDITERKKAESVLKENEGQLAIVAQIAKLGYWEFDVAKNLFTFNDQFYSIFNTTAEDVGGYTMSSEKFLHLFVHPDDFSIVANESANAIKSSDPGYNQQIEYRIKYAGGSIGYVTVCFFIVKNESGRTVKTYGAIRDITEKKNAEAVLIKRDSQLILAAQMAKLGYWEFDVVNDVFTFNDQFYAVFKTTVEKVGGYTMSSARYTELFVHPEEREIVGKSVEEAINSADSHFSFRAEHRIIYATGEIGYVSVHFYIVKDEQGRTIRNFGVNQDITEHKNAQQAIRNSEETTKLIMNSALDAIVGIDTGGYITVWTPQAEKIFGWKEDEVIGKPLTEIIIPGQYRERHKQGFERYLQTGKGVILNKLTELSALNREGKEFPIEISIVSIKQGYTEFFCAFIRDITERKNAEKLLQKSQASLAINNHQLEQKNKELEQFAYVASHDMQEPLRTTSSFVELLQKQYGGRLDEKADKYLTFISQSSDRMKVLIKDLLDYSRIGRKKEVANVDCSIILSEVLADLGKAITEAHAEIEADNLPVISGYATEIKQLFQNLIMNAIKFRKQNTTPEINICVQKKGGYWEFAVKDNGIGIDEQHQERIFVIFQRLHTRNEYEGSGIGLAHCKKIVELHGGKIWIESQPGKGSTFHFTIPENNN